ncbi:hypothetical protein LX36DRAFT_447186 [Colletotrichum falcatum]|nr:hypothetical protein LX36DRAFT_447186 [Colletotrichum falcatum]
MVRLIPSRSSVISNNVQCTYSLSVSRGFDFIFWRTEYQREEERQRGGEGRKRFIHQHDRFTNPCRIRRSSMQPIQKEEQFGKMGPFHLGTGTDNNARELDRDAMRRAPAPATVTAEQKHNGTGETWTRKAQVLAVFLFLFLLQPLTDPFASLTELLPPPSCQDHSRLICPSDGRSNACWLTRLLSYSLHPKEEREKERERERERGRERQEGRGKRRGLPKP